MKHIHENEIVSDKSVREFVRFVTPSGVTGIVASCIPLAALDMLVRKLERKIARRARALHPSVERLPASAPSRPETAAGVKAKAG